MPGEAPPKRGSGATGESVFLWAAVAVLLLALVARVSNAFLLPPLKDFDAPGHALNAFALYEGRLPDPRSWSGFHPPLYYAVGALIWHGLPEGVAVHTGLRLLSLAFGAAAVGLVFRTLSPRLGRTDAAVVAAVAFCAPVVSIATSMLGNETTCAFFVTAALARLCTLPEGGGATPREAAITGLLAGLAALAKATGVIAAGSVLASYLLAMRRSPRRALPVLAAAALGPVLLLAPLYVHLLRETGGSASAIVSGSAASPDARAEMAEQPPGLRRLSHYVSFPASSLLAPVYSAPGLTESVPGLFYATLQADGQGQFLPPTEAGIFGAGRALALAGLLPTGLALFGMLRALRAPARFAWMGPLGLFALLMGTAFLRYAWVFPHFSAVKASYALSALLPAAAALGVGIHGVAGGWRQAARAGLLAVALLDAVLLWQGWWV